MEPITNQVPQTPVEPDAGAVAEPQAGTPAEASQEPVAPAAPANPDAGTGTGAVRNSIDTPAAAPAEDPYEKKFAMSTTENQRLMDAMAANGIDPKTGKPVAQPVANPVAQPLPTAPQPSNLPVSEADRAAAIPGYNALTPEQKDVIRDTKQNAKTQAAVQGMVAEMYDERETNRQVKELVGKDENKLIADNEKAFREYIYKPENLKVPMEHLTRSFMYELSQGTIEGAAAVAPATAPAAPQGMEPGTSGGKELGTINAAGGTEMTASEAAEMRANDQQRYNNLAAAGKLVIIEG